MHLTEAVSNDIWPVVVPAKSCRSEIVLASPYIALHHLCVRDMGVAYVIGFPSMNSRASNVTLSAQLLFASVNWLTSGVDHECTEIWNGVPVAILGTKQQTVGNPEGP